MCITAIAVIHIPTGTIIINFIFLFLIYKIRRLIKSLRREKRDGKIGKTDLSDSDSVMGS